MFLQSWKRGSVLSKVQQIRCNLRKESSPLLSIEVKEDTGLTQN